MTLFFLTLDKEKPELFKETFERVLAQKKQRLNKPISVAAPMYEEKKLLLRKIKNCSRQ